MAGGIARARHSGRLAALLLFASLSGWHSEAAAHDVGKRPPGRFDFYVLSLAWVPGFCATHRGHRGECRKGLGFALHGLWPQLASGDYPTNCSEVALSSSEIQRHADLYAEPSLIEHEWAKHGTCSGLPPTAYFELTARDVRRVRIPAAASPDAVFTSENAGALRSAFMTANPGLSSDSIATITFNGIVTEIDLCLSKTGYFRSCR